MLSKLSLQSCTRVAAGAPLPCPRAAAAAAAAALRQTSCCWATPPHRHCPAAQQRWRATAAAAAAVGEDAAAAAAAATESTSIYDRPQLYDDAFSYRDFVAEAKFLMGAYQKHALPGGKLRSVLELGCGPANHAIQLAQRGVQAWALDSNAAMLAHAAAKAAAAGVESGLTTVQGDMAEFSIQGMEGRFDLVVCLLGTLSHMLDNRQAAAALSQAARHLRPGGLLLLELAHPGDLFDGSLLLQDVGAELWEVERRAGGGPKLTVMWGTDLDDFDPVTQVLYRTVSIHEQSGGQEGGELGPCLLEEVVPYRQFTAQEVELLGMISGLEVVGQYGDLDLGVSLTHEDAFRMVVCLRKQGLEPDAGGQEE